MLEAGHDPVEALGQIIGHNFGGLGPYTPQSKRSAALQQQVGQRLRLQREARGMTQQELAGALHYSQTAVSYWESGKRSLGMDDLIAIAAVLKVPVATLTPDMVERDQALRDMGNLLLSVGRDVAEFAKVIAGSLDQCLQFLEVLAKAAEPPPDEPVQ